MVFGNNYNSSVLIEICIKFEHMLWEKFNRSKIFLIPCQNFKYPLIKLILRRSQIQKVKISDFQQSFHNRFPFSFLNNIKNFVIVGNNSSWLYFQFLKHHHFSACQRCSDLLVTINSIRNMNVSDHSLVIKRVNNVKFFVWEDFIFCDDLVSF